MHRLYLERPNFTRSTGAASWLQGGFNRAPSKGSSRPPQHAQFSSHFGRVQTLVQHDFHPPTTKIRLTDVCRFWAARLSPPVTGIVI